MHRVHTVLRFQANMPDVAREWYVYALLILLLQSRRESSPSSQFSVQGTLQNKIETDRTKNRTDRIKKLYCSTYL